jgi:pyruvate/2-oxoglutarate/acetoin dehydrogenase E1 component
VPHAKGNLLCESHNSPDPVVLLAECDSLGLNGGPCAAERCPWPIGDAQRVGEGENVRVEVRGTAADR